MKQEYSAGVVIFYECEDGIEFLLLHYAAGHWDFPKGHIEKGETKEIAALRELQEETGMTDVSIIPGFQESFIYFFRSPDSKELIKKTVYFFIGQALKKDVQLSQEHIGYAWLPFEKALGQLTYKNAQELLQQGYEFLKIYIKKGSDNN